MTYTDGRIKTVEELIEQQIQEYRDRHSEDYQR